MFKTLFCKHRWLADEANPYSDKKYSCQCSKCLKLKFIKGKKIPKENILDITFL
jgi:hypothetical protein